VLYIRTRLTPFDALVRLLASKNDTSAVSNRSSEQDGCPIFLKNRLEHVESGLVAFCMLLLPSTIINTGSKVETEFINFFKNIETSLCSRKRLRAD